MFGVVSAVIRRQEGRNGGYGFIQDEASGERFFHANNLEGIKFERVTEGMRVEFEAVEIPGKGLRAVKVRAA